MLFRKRRIYLDYASAPPVRGEAKRAMKAAAHIGNPGAIHREGVEAKRALEDARARIAKLLTAKSREIVFTSGLTEANNLAMLGFGRALERTGKGLKGTHWIVSAIEHASVLECFSEIERLGGVVTHIDSDERGVVRPEAIAIALRPETVFVSVGWANNETGVVQPLSEIERVIRCREKGDSIVFHSDAGQAPLYKPTGVHSLGVDLLSLGGNKLYGPHGVGALYINNRLTSEGIEIASHIVGGPQERRLRAGTENVALACGFAAAYEAVAKERAAESARLEKLRDDFARDLIEKIPGLLVNGDLKRALPHMLNISIPDINSEYVALQLDHADVAVSTKSACREGEESRSHVVESLAGPEWRARNTLRFSLGRETLKRDLSRVAALLSDLMQTAVEK